MKTPEHVEWLGIIGSRWAWATVIGAIAFFGSLTFAPEPSAPIPSPTHVQPLLGSTPVSGPSIIGETILGATIPEQPFPTQLTKCDPRQAQVEIRGGCWVKTETTPPCPDGFQWEWKDTCWLPALRAARTPTTGDPEIPVGVSGPTTP